MPQIKNITVNFVDKENPIHWDIEIRKAFLAALLDGLSKNVFYFKDEIKIIYHDKEFHFNLTQPIFYYSTEISQEPRFAVTNENDEIGKGGFGSVSKIPGVIIPTFDGNFIFKTEPVDRPNTTALALKKVYKESMNDEAFKAMVNAEYFVANLTDYFKVKKPVFLENEALLAMTYIDAQPLHLFLINNLHLSPVIRLDICINYLLKVQHKIHDRNIVHLDFKPSNLFIDEKNMYEITISDFGTARPSSKAMIPSELVNYFQDPESNGTDDYKSVEQDDISLITKATDYAGCGRTLADIFLAGSQLRPARTSTPASYTAKSFNIHAYGNNLLPKNSHELACIINTFFLPNPEDRGTLQDAIEDLETMRLREVIYRADPSAISQIQTANTLGRNLRNELTANELEKELRKKSLTYLSLPQQLELIISKLRDSNLENPAAINEFITCLKIKALKGMTTIKEIENKLTEIWYSFDDVLKNVIAAQKYLEEYLEINDSTTCNNYNAVNRMLMWIDKKVLAKHRKYSANFDDIEKFTIRLNNALGAITVFIRNMKAVEPVELKLKAQYNFLKNNLDFDIQYQNELADLRSMANSSHLITINDLKKFDIFTFAGILSTETDPLSKLKNAYKQAISDYIESTYTEKNIQKNDRAASARRQRNIKTLLEAIEKADSIPNLQEEMQHLIRSIKPFYHGFFKCGSELVKGLQKVHSQVQRSEPLYNTDREPTEMRDLISDGNTLR